MLKLTTAEADLEFGLRVEFVQAHSQLSADIVACAIRYSDPALVALCSPSVQASIPETAPISPGSFAWGEAVRAGQHARAGNGPMGELSGSPHPGLAYLHWRKNRLAERATAPAVAGPTKRAAEAPKAEPAKSVATGPSAG